MSNTDDIAPKSFGRSTSNMPKTPPSDALVLDLLRDWAEAAALHVAHVHPTWDGSRISRAIRRRAVHLLFLLLADACGVARPRDWIAGTSDETLDGIPGVSWPDAVHLSVLSLGRAYEHLSAFVWSGGQRLKSDLPSLTNRRKSSGVYYTPNVVVSYLLDRTLDPVLDKAHRPSDLQSLHVLDPACGSGAFLLGAFERLARWHLSWYVAHDAARWSRGRHPTLYRTADGTWQLTTAERSRLVDTHLFGVDIDAVALETSRLSLVLAAYAGEREEQLGRTMSLFPVPTEGVWKSLLHQGDSLVEPGAPLEASPTGVPGMDWDAAFPTIMQDGGFEVVVGNPPYISYGGRHRAEVAPIVRERWQRQYRASGWLTSHGMFLERALTLLSRGVVGFIVPDQVGHLDGYASLRKVLLDSAGLREVRYWGEQVFEGVATPALTVVLDRRWEGETTIIERDGTRRQGVIARATPWSLHPHRRLLAKISLRSMSIRPWIGDCGIRTTHAKTQVVGIDQARGEHVVVLEGKQIGPFWCKPPTRAVLLSTGRDVLMSRLAKYEGAKFLIRQTAAYPIVGPHRHAVHFRNSLHGLFEPPDGPDIRYLVGLLNSDLLRFAYVVIVREASQRTFPQVKLGALAKLPVRAIDPLDPVAVSLRDQVITTVQGLLDTYEQAHGDDGSALGQVEKLTAKLNELVFRLYDLSDGEMRQVREVLSEVPVPPVF